MSDEKPVEILIFTSQSFPLTGGVSRVIDALAGGMNSFGFRTRLLAPIEENAPSFSYPVIPLRHFPDDYPLASENFNRVERIMERNLEIIYRKHPFELIHAHLAYPAGYCAALWGKRHRVPVIITCHGHDIQNPDNDPDDSCHPVLWEKIRKKMIEGFHLADLVTVPSRDMVQKMESWGVKTHHIPNGVHFDHISKINPRLEGDWREKPFILSIGRFRNMKGFDLLLRSFSLVAGQHKDLGLVILGEGCGIYPLLEHSLFNKLRGRVFFVTAGGEDKKWSLLKKCKLYICPSRIEGFGIAVLEAMACSRPVVAFRIGGLTDLIENEKNGLLVPPYDTAAMAGAIERILTDCTLAEKMSQESQKRAVRFNWPIILDKYRQLYRRTLEPG